MIACIGETLEERESGKTNEVVERQVKAYQGEIEDETFSRSFDWIFVFRKNCS